MKDSHRIDIILPCYNPSEGWAENVVSRTAQIREVCSEISVGCIVVNDGSQKGISPDDLTILQRGVPDLQWIEYQRNRGKGYALREGVSQSTANIILYTDIDFPYSTASILDCLHAVTEAGADIALAVRNDSYYRQLPAFRRLISRLLKNVNRVLLGMQTSDTQGGLKVFNRKGREVFLRTRIDRYLFDLEFIYLASKKENIRIEPVEADLREGIEFTTVRSDILFHEGLNFLKVLFRGARENINGKV